MTNDDVVLAAMRLGMANVTKAQVVSLAEMVQNDVARQKDKVIKALADALDGLHQVAFRGPDEQKGGPGQETYYNWRERIRLEAEDILRLVVRLP